jgi:phosphate transport system substrate-binding protein
MVPAGTLRAVSQPKKEPLELISRKSILAIFACGLLAIGIAACGGDDDGGGSSDLSGTIRLDGSSTVFPFAQAAAELFREDNPNVKISVGEAGTSGGFEKFCAGEIDISNASRPIEPEEVDVCKKDGIAYTEIPVANDGISITTNPALEISCLTTDQLKELWETTTVGNYSELGEDADTGQPLPDASVSLYGPGTDSGTFDYFTDVINGEEGVSRDDYQPSEDDNVLVEGVSGDQDGLGYFGFSYYAQNQDALNLVSVDDGNGCVAPSNETIQSGEYAPLSRGLFMYPSADAIAKPEVQAYMQYVVDNYESIAEQAQIVPMDSTQASDASAALDKASG